MKLLGEEKKEDEAKSILDKSDHNINPKESEKEEGSESDEPEEEIRQITIDLQNPKTSDEEMYRLLQRLGNIKRKC